jgi:L-ascorbate metabolism protein UlaG (beta-lactamase superfamily)
MKLTKYNHATVVLEKDGATLVVDPGGFTPESAELVRGAAGVLITHEHLDHFDPDALRPALEADPDLVVVGPAPIAEQLGDLGSRVHVVAAGESLEVGPFAVQVFGETHAVIHRDLPLFANVGYLVDGAVFHPGDAYLVPGVPVETLLIPTSGPWVKTGEGIDYIREVDPKRAIQIHELMLSETGQKSNVTMLGVDGLGGVPTEILAVGSSTEV